MQATLVGIGMPIGPLQESTGGSLGPTLAAARQQTFASVVLKPKLIILMAVVNMYVD